MTYHLHYTASQLISWSRHQCSRGGIYGMGVRLSQFSLTGINPQIVKQILCLNPQPELINRQTQ